MKRFLITEFRIVSYTARNTQVAAKSDAGLVPCNHQDNIGMQLHRLMMYKSAASYQQA